MNKKFLRIFSIILSLIMLIQMAPLQVWAQQVQTQVSAPPTEQIETEQVQKTDNVITEIPEKRTEYSKEFMLGSGLHMATVYPDPVHYETADGWAEIDNTLITKSGSTYGNTAGIWDVRFPQQLSSGNSVVIEKDGYTLSFAMAGELRSTGFEVMKTEQAELSAQTEPITVTEATVSEITTESTTEATAETTMETIPETVFETTTETVPETAVETIPETTTETVPETTAETIPETTTETVPETTAETIPETTTETVPETTAPVQTVSLIEVEETLPQDDTQVTMQLESGKVETFAVSGMQSSPAVIQELDLNTRKADMEHPETLPEKLQSRLTYANVYQNTSVQYDLNSNTVKESIIIARHNSALRGYRYTLNVGQLIPVLSDGGQIDFYNPNRENIVMSMPAPYLLDANNTYNDDIQVRLTGSGSTYTLTYLLPTQWLAETDRAWPVVLDPVVVPAPITSNIIDKTIAENNTFTDSTMQGYLYTGYTNFGAARSYLMFNELPTLTSSDVIINASVSLDKTGTTSEATTIEVHKVTTAWSDVTSWQYKPDIDDKIEDYAIVMNSGRYYWDVTDIVRDWYTGTNTGMLFKASDSVEQAQVRNSISFFSSDYSDYNDSKPILFIYYRNNNGLEDYWDYTPASAGRAGTGYINNFTGNLVWVRDCIGFDGNRMPVNISLVYNLNDSSTSSFGLGCGWRTNYHQRVYHWDHDKAAYDYYVWEDADGTRHYFQKSETDSSKYIHEDNENLTLVVGGSGELTYALWDKNGNASYFDAQGRLTWIDNNQQTLSSIHITYKDASSSLISMITDGAGRKYIFDYNEYNFVRWISYYGSEETEISWVMFNYLSDKLHMVTDPDYTACYYDYSGNILTSVRMVDDSVEYIVDKYKLTYTYNTPTSSWQPYRVLGVKEYSRNVEGNELNIEYGHNQTKFTDHNGNVEIVQFNDRGNTVSIQDDEGRAQYAEFAINNDHEASSNTDPTKKANQLTVASQLQNTVGNRFRDPSFELVNDWVEYSDYLTLSRTTEDAYMGNWSLKLTADANGQVRALGSGCTIPAWECYVFSAYVKSAGATGYIAFQRGSDYTLKYGNSITKDQDWTRLEVFYTNSTPYAVTVNPCIVLDTVGSVYVDGIQMECADAPSRLNLVHNGDFTHEATSTSAANPVYGWSSTTLTSSDGRVTTGAGAPATQLDGAVLQMYGDPQAAKELTTNLSIAGSAGDSFVLTGWAWANSVPIPDGETNRAFNITVSLNHYDHTTNSSAVAEFNPDCDDWQYAATAVVAKQAFESVTITLKYNYNANDVFFDGIQLYKEGFGVSYTYDEDGNVKSVTDIRNQNTTYEYQNNNLTQIIQNGTAKMTYTYDDYHNVKTATNATGQVYNFTYDTYGNNTGVSITDSNGVTISSSAQYTNPIDSTTANANRLLRTTDSLGNDTFYYYDENTNMLEKTIAPGNDPSTCTDYTYDNLYRLTKVIGYTSSGWGPFVEYTYEDDLLSTIHTVGGTFRFTYGDFSLRTAFSVDGEEKPLATYEYTDDRNNFLKKLAYGNDDSVSYTYDDKGRLLTQTYEDSDTIEYYYDNDGLLAEEWDYSNGTINNYTYNLIGELVQHDVVGGDFPMNLFYTYDDQGNLTHQKEIIGTGDYKDTSNIQFTYDEDNRIVTKQTDSANRTYQYDSFGRVSSEVGNLHGTERIRDTYTYRNPSSTTTSAQIASHTITTANADTTKTFSYQYDAKGNITSITHNGKTTSYAYDSQSQLLRENNEAEGYTYVWTYDRIGNIMSKSVYPYTAGTLSGDPTTVISYQYNPSGWQDKLIKFGSYDITYDAIGNTLSDGIRSYNWEHGRQMASVEIDGTTWTNTYNNTTGLRLSRSNGSKTYKYVYANSQLVRMTVDDQDIWFSYDADGAPLSIYYNYTYYFYITNLQGDVIGIADSDGNQVVSYSYDAWGNLLSCTSADSYANLALHNPLRYRGYVYDVETGLYYVSSRYYDPEIGRWISPEPNVYYGEFDEAAGLLGYNVYAYCANNPVMFKDETGESITLACVLIFGGIGLLAGGHFAAKASKAKLGYVNGWWVLGGMVVGGGVGALLGWGVGSAATAIGAKLAAGSSGTLGKVIYSSWQSAEKALRTAYKGAKATFNTPWGKRIIDSYSKNVIREAKYGYQGLSKFIQQEINKDVWILKNTSVKSIEWHFYWSSVSNSGGPSGPLLKELARYGIKVIFH